MGTRVTAFHIWFHVDFRAGDDQGNYLVVDYRPVGIDEEGHEQMLPMYDAQLNTTFVNLSEDMQGKLKRLGDYARAALEVPEIEIAGTALRGQPVLQYIQVNRQRANAVYRASPSTRNPTDVDISKRLPEGAWSLIENLKPMCERLAWDDLRTRLGGDAAPQPDTRKRVLVSYKAGPQEREKFVEAIAHRLGREQFIPWFDKWEIKAGDSIARQLGEGFRDVAAILIVLTPDYPGERWAREELERAITKRVEEKIRVIPVIYEPCPLPELLGNLRYVDCTSHDEAVIERQFSDLIDALNEIELNPYRRQT